MEFKRLKRQIMKSDKIEIMFLHKIVSISSKLS